MIPAAAILANPLDTSTPQVLFPDRSQAVAHPAFYRRGGCFRRNGETYYYYGEGDSGYTQRGCLPSRTVRDATFSPGLLVRRPAQDTEIRTLDLYVEYVSRRRVWWNGVISDESWADWEDMWAGGGWGGSVGIGEVLHGLTRNDSGADKVTAHPEYTGTGGPGYDGELFGDVWAGDWEWTVYPSAEGGTTNHWRERVETQFRLTFVPPQMQIGGPLGVRVTWSGSAGTFVSEADLRPFLVSHWQPGGGDFGAIYPGTFPTTPIHTLTTGSGWVDLSKVECEFFTP